MRIQVLTIFPELFRPFLETALLGRARERGHLDVEVHDLRDFTLDRHRSVDDEPFGGGGGMVMTAPPWLAAVRQLAQGAELPGGCCCRPRGTGWTRPKCASSPGRGDLLLLCGRYEGIDERVRQTVVDEEISVGDFVVSGGELPAMLLIEAVSRQVPGVVQRTDSVERDSFRAGLLDFPHYTRPAEVEGLPVPDGPPLGRPRRHRALAGARSAASDAREAAGSAGHARPSPRLRAGSWRASGPRSRPPSCPKRRKT